ncbi:MAG: hypothetical protein HOM16_08320, partial [Woeseia sp.]|nr:hypothetical protein [Woeseia sp.]
MITRRDFSMGSLAGAAALGSSSLQSAFSADTPTQSSLVIDAMGEVREVYTDSLCREMIDSGINSITVTLCDPKSFEAEAYAWAIDGVLAYDKLIDQEPNYWMKATRVADIQTARDQGRIAL